eukprot:scaffold3356_cov264-Pinguiococcus_pyrenoidosus.AAC.6
MAGARLRFSSVLVCRFLLLTIGHLLLRQRLRQVLQACLRCGEGPEARCTAHRSRRSRQEDTAGTAFAHARDDLLHAEDRTVRPRFVVVQQPIRIHLRDADRRHGPAAHIVDERIWNPVGFDKRAQGAVNGCLVRHVPGRDCHSRALHSILDQLLRLF